MFKAGQRIVYTVAEEETPIGYIATVSRNSEIEFIVLNRHHLFETEATVIKVWDDNDDQDKVRPESITVQLSNGTEVVATVTLSAENGWKATVTGLPKYSGGKLIEYRWTEGEIAGYTLTGNSTEGTVTTLTNRHEPETTKISGKKTWIDNDDHDGMRPEKITVKLYADGELVATKTISALDGWRYSFKDLPKYKDGAEIVYTVEEEAVEGYTVRYDGYDIINTHELETVELKVEKQWIDNNDQYAKRPSAIKISLCANGTKIETVTIAATDGWKYVFTGLAKYDANGKEIRYTVTEEPVPGYSAIIAGDMSTGIVIANKYEEPDIPIEPPKTEDETEELNTAAGAVFAGISAIALAGAAILTGKKRENNA